MDEPSRLAAEREIERLPAVYALAVDRRDWETVGSVFDPSCEVAGSLGTAPIAEYLPRIREYCEGFAKTMHNVTTVVVALEDEERALLDHFAIAHYVDPLDGGGDHSAGVHYADLVRRGEGGWKIASRQVEFPWRKESL